MSRRLALVAIAVLALASLSHAQTRIDGPTAIIPGPTPQICFEPTPGAGPDVCIQRTGPNALQQTNGIGTTGTPIGGTGVGAGASPVIGWFLQPNCPVANTSQCFNSPVDTQQINTCGWTGSTVTCTGNPFVAGDVGKTIMGWDKCQLFNSGGVGVNALVSPGNSNTIAGFTNSNTVTLTSAVANTESGTAGCLVWGHPDDAGADALDTAVQAAVQCPRIIFGGGYYLFSRPHFFTVPASCSNLPFTFPFQNTLGNMLYSGGYEIDGRGTGATVWWLTPNFPGSGACNHGTLAKACFVIPAEGRWSQFSITGGGDNSNQGLSLIQIQGPVSFDSITVSNWNPNGGGSVTACIGLRGWVFMTQVINSGCGNIGIMGDGGNILLTAYNLSVNNIKQWGIVVNWAANSGRYSSTIFNLDLDVMANAASGIVMNVANAAIKLYHPNIYSTTSPTSMNDILCITTSCSIDIQDGSIGGGGAAGSGIVSSSAPMTVVLQDVGLFATGSGIPYSDTSTSLLIDHGGNSGFGSGGGTTITGQVQGEANSTFTLVTAAKLVLSGGWGTTAAWTALSGGNAPIQGTITNSGTGQGASPTITYTFPTPYLVAPFSCAATQVGGTNATGTFTASVPTKTGVTFTFSLTPTASSTEIVQVTCVTP